MQVKTITQVNKKGSIKQRKKREAMFNHGRVLIHLSGEVVGGLFFIDKYSEMAESFCHVEVFMRM
ncbi:MAG: hypothetical protein U9Q58_03245 [Pseudomonadota bacterium]|nr:hypothetical protein [Pseudomonadota bacterium]